MTSVKFLLSSFNDCISISILFIPLHYFTSSNRYNLISVIYNILFILITYYYCSTLLYCKISKNSVSIYTVCLKDFFTFFIKDFVPPNSISLSTFSYRSIFNSSLYINFKIVYSIITFRKSSCIISS